MGNSPRSQRQDNLVHKDRLPRPRLVILPCPPIAATTGSDLTLPPPPAKCSSVSCTPSTTSGRTLMPPPPIMFPQIPSYTAHSDQLTLPTVATQLLSMLLTRPTADWKLTDFTTKGQVRLSTLVSLFVDYATREGDIPTAHRGLVARRASITHPSRLLHKIWTGDNIMDYVQQSCTMIPPPLLQDQLCPARTSDLVANDGLRSRIHDPKLTRGDLLQLILPYAQHMYSSFPDLPMILRRMSLSEISGLVYTPGAFHRELISCKQVYLFHPPSWYHLVVAFQKVIP